MEKRLKRIDNLIKQQQRIIDQLEKTKQQHTTELFKIFKRLPLHTIQPDILIGGLQYVCNEAAKNSAMVEGWRHAGEKFRHKRSAQKAQNSLQQGA